MFELLAFVAAAGAGWFGFKQTRTFVRRRLRFIDIARKPVAPILAGVAAVAVAAPVVALLPVVGAGTALVFGLGVGAGTRAGVRDIREGSTDLEPFID